MLRLSLIIWLLVTVSGQQLYAQCGPRYQEKKLFEVKVTKDIQYGEAWTSKGKSQQLHFDFYEPFNDTSQSRPLLIYLHGGSFLDGNKNLLETTAFCKAMAQRGYVVAAVNYRTEDNYLALVFSELMFKATIRASHDAKAAIRYFYRQAKDQGNTYKIDTNQIFLGGLSAGAITALHTAYLDDIHEADFLMAKFINDLGGLEGESGNPGFSTKIKGVINLAGCMLDKSYVNNNKNIPLLNIQYSNDWLLPSYYGRPYNIFTLPIMMGSRVIAKQMDKLGMYHMSYTPLGRGHIPYYKDGRLNEELLDTVANYSAKFMFSLLECNPARVNLEKIQPIDLHELSIYPNPNQGILILGEQKFDVKLIKHLRIVDMAGRVVHQEKINDNWYVFDISHLPYSRQLYIVEVLDAHHQILAQQKLFFVP